MCVRGDAADRAGESTGRQDPVTAERPLGSVPACRSVPGSGGVLRRARLATPGLHLTTGFWILGFWILGFWILGFWILCSVPGVHGRGEPDVGDLDVDVAAGGPQALSPTVLFGPARLSPSELRACTAASGSPGHGSPDAEEGPNDNEPLRFDDDGHLIPRTGPNDNEPLAPHADDANPVTPAEDGAYLAELRDGRWLDLRVWTDLSEPATLSIEGTCAGARTVRLLFHAFDPTQSSNRPGHMVQSGFDADSGLYRIDFRFDIEQVMNRLDVQLFQPDVNRLDLRAVLRSQADSRPLGGGDWHLALFDQPWLRAQDYGVATLPEDRGGAGDGLQGIAGPETNPEADLQTGTRFVAHPRVGDSYWFLVATEDPEALDISPLDFGQLISRCQVLSAGSLRMRGEPRIVLDVDTEDLSRSIAPYWALWTLGIDGNWTRSRGYLLGR